MDVSIVTQNNYQNYACVCKLGLRGSVVEQSLNYVYWLWYAIVLCSHCFSIDYDLPKIHGHGVDSYAMNICFVLTMIGVGKPVF